jgi:hypothetical protein
MVTNRLYEYIVKQTEWLKRSLTKENPDLGYIISYKHFIIYL